MSSKIYKPLIYIIPLVVIMVLVLWYKDVNYYPKLYGDEYGYLASGAYFAGLDWNDVTALNEYYGWGYGLILSFVLRLPISSKACYISAIALNGILLWGIYAIYYKLARELFIDRSEFFCSVLAFACAVLPSSLYYTQFTISEVILEFVYCLLIYELWLFIKNSNVKRIIIIALLNAWLMSIHLRTIGIIAISVVIVIGVCCSLTSKRIRSLLLFFAVLIIALLTVNWVKHAFQDGIALSFMMLKTGNTASGQMGKFQSLITLAGFKSFISNIIGRLFSLSVNSYMLAPIAIVVGAYDFFSGIKNKKINHSSLLSIVCIGNTISLITISALYMIGNTGSRFDILTYSRYHEFSSGILILFGLYYLSSIVKKTKANMLVVGIALFVLGLSGFVTSFMNYDSTTSNLYAHNPRVLFFYGNVDNIKELFIIMFIIALFSFILLFVFLKYKTTKLVVFVLSILIIANIYESDYIFKVGALSWCEDYFVETDNLKDFIVSNDYQQSLCFLNDDDVLKIDLLRFAMKNDRIVVVDENQLSNIMRDDYILIATRSYSGEADFDDYEVIYEDHFLYLWRLADGE